MKKKGRKKPYKYGTGKTIESPEDLFKRAPYNYFIKILELAKQIYSTGLRNSEFRWVLNKPRSEHYPKYKMREILPDKFDGAEFTTKQEQRGYFLEHLKKVGVPVNLLNMSPQTVYRFLSIIIRKGIVEKRDNRYELSNQYYPRCIKIISKRLIDRCPIDSILFHRDLESITIYGIDKKLYTEKDITRIEEEMTPIKNAIKALQDIKSDRVVDYWKELIKPVEKLSISRDLINTIKRLDPFHICLLLWDDVKSKKKWTEDCFDMLVYIQACNDDVNSKKKLTEDELLSTLELYLNKYDIDEQQKEYDIDEQQKEYDIDEQQKEELCTILWDATKKTQEKLCPKTGVTLVVTTASPYGGIELRYGKSVAEIW